MKRLHGIQYLRAVAALGVVVFHAAERAGAHFAVGAAGVDIFFVISGFIMWVIASEREPSPAAFLRDRIERIAPLYWIATGVMVTGALVGLFPNLRLTAGYVLSSFFFLASRSPATGDIWPVLVQGWTLNYEMFFYALFAAALFVPARLRLAAMTALFLALATTGWLFAPETPVLKVWTDPLLLEFLIGMAIGRAWLKGAIPSPATGIALMAVAVVGFAFVGITYAGFNPFVLGPLAAALVLGILTFERHAAVPSLPLVSYLGDASYSIYLWHTMAISVVAKAGSALSLPGSVVFGIAVVSGIAVGVAAREVLEKPIAALLRRRRRRRCHAPSAAAAQSAPEAVLRQSPP